MEYFTSKSIPTNNFKYLCFLDDKEDNLSNPNNLNKFKSHPKYKKYFKMVSCVPKLAIAQNDFR